MRKNAVCGSVGLVAAAAAVGLGACEGTPTCPDQPGIACVYIGTGQVALGEDGLPARQTDIYWAIDLEFAPDGTAWFIDWNNHLVRHVRPDGTVETVVGDFVGDGDPDGAEFTPEGADPRLVRLNHPTDLVFDEQGDLLLMAWHNHKIRELQRSTGRMHVLYGSAPGFAGDGTMGQAVRFNQPKALVRARDGTLYVLDQRNFLIRRIGPDGMVTTFAGIPPAPGAMPMPGYEGDGGPASMARFRFEAGPNPEPSGGLALDEERGVLYVADGLNYRIRAIELETGTIDTVIGTGENGYSGDGGPGRSARISHVRDLEIGPHDGRLYFADTENHVIRAWDPRADVVETVVGTGERGRGEEGRPATETALDRPMGIAFDAAGALYVADTMNSRYLRIGR